jgi:hypothetical protein
MSAKRGTFNFFTYVIHMTPSPRFLLESDAAKFGLALNNPAAVLGKKNEILQRCLLDAKELSPHRTNTLPIKKKNFIVKDGTFLLRVGSEKSINLSDEDLVDHVTPHFPYVYVYFDNRKDEQVLAIQQNPAVFSDTKVTAKIIQENINSMIAPFNLECVIKPQFDDNDFWKYVEKHQKSIVRLQFSILAPNLPRIRISIPEELNRIQSSIGSQLGKFDFQSLTNSHLTISKNNEDIAGLAKAAADGGGEIRVKIKNMKKFQCMAKTTKELSIKEFDAAGKPEDVQRAIEKLLES